MGKTRNTILLALVVAAVGSPELHQAGTTPGWRQALAVRSEALNREYHLGPLRRSGGGSDERQAGVAQGPGGTRTCDEPAVQPRCLLDSAEGHRRQDVCGSRCTARGAHGRRRARSTDVTSSQASRSEICLRADTTVAVADRTLPRRRLSALSRRRRRTSPCPTPRARPARRRAGRAARGTASS